MTLPRLDGIVTPLLTPFDADRQVATRLFCDHARFCLAQGSHLLAPFGTTGEAASLSMAARKRGLEDLIKTGAAPAEYLLPGTGLTALEDTVTLTRHAHDLGVAGVLMLPPYFFKNPSQDEVYRYFATVIEQLGAECPRIVLYHIPAQTGLPISPALTRKLALDFPGVIAGYKDSSNQWSNSAQILRVAPDVAVFTASEALMPQALASGAAGCISATCNVNTAQIRTLFDCLRDKRAAEAKDLVLSVSHARTALAKGGLITACKSVLAARTQDPDWLRCLPPLHDAPAELPTALEPLVAPRDYSAGV